MKSCKSLLYLLALAAVLTSCGKKLEMATPDNPLGNPPGTPGNGNGNTSSIEGSWNFAGVTLNVGSTATAANAKTVSSIYYNTTRNAGLFVIDATKFTITSLTYDINGAMRTAFYLDGVKVGDDMDIPLTGTMDPYNATTNYKKVTADSIYFESSIVEFPNSLPVTSQPAGARISWAGDTLILTTFVDQVDNGAFTKGTAVFKLVKRK